MRDRLSQLIYNKLSETCRECSSFECTEELTDYLLANGVIVPPCKVGDTVWCIIDGFNRAMEGRVRRFTAYENFINIYCGINGYYEQNYTDKEFGQTIFLTKEEAEKALKGGAER